MEIESLESTNSVKIAQACKDANIALTLAIISIYVSLIPILGIVIALVAERLAYNTPDVEGITNVQTKKNVVHSLTPFTFLLSVFFLIAYYYVYSHRY